MRQADYAILAAILAVAIGICMAMFLRPSQAEGVSRVEFAEDPTEQAYEPKVAETTPPEAPEIDAVEAESGVEAPFEVETVTYTPDEQTAPYTPSAPSGGIYVAEYDPAYNENGPTREMPGWYDGYLETYYNASAHYLASTWTLDDEGFYRDSEGRYVVGVEIGHADEMPYGTVVMTGRGEGVVYDYGAGAEVHDFATAW